MTQIRWRDRLHGAFKNLRSHITETGGHVHYMLIEPKEYNQIPLGTVQGVWDNRRLIEFDGQELAQRNYASGNKRITETLYQIGFKRYLVHVRTLTKTRGLPTRFELHHITDGELQFGGEFELLGRLRSKPE